MTFRTHICEGNLKDLSLKGSWTRHSGSDGYDNGCSAQRTAPWLCSRTCKQVGEGSSTVLLCRITLVILGLVLDSHNCQFDKDHSHLRKSHLGDCPDQIGL